MLSPLRILILEDRPADAELMVNELQRAGFEPDFQCVESEETYLHHLEDGIDVILADYTLPQFDALRALHLLQERGLDIPFVVVTGSVSEEAAVACMKQGAADYLLKDRLTRLGPAVESALQEKVLRDEKRQAQQALEQVIERLRTLRAIDGAILAAWSAEEIAQVTLGHIIKLVPCRRISVTAFDLQAQEATVLAAHGVGERPVPGLGAGTRFPIEPGALIEKLHRGGIHIVEDIAGLPTPTKTQQILAAAGIHRSVNVPLIARGELIGSLNLGLGDTDVLLPDHIDIARELADRVAIAIQQARLHQQVQHHAEVLEQEVAERTQALERRSMQLQVAAEVARDAATARDAGDLMRRAANLIRERFGLYHAGIFLTDEEGEYAVLQASSGQAGRRTLDEGHRLKVGQTGIVGYVTGSGQPRIALDVGTDAVHFEDPVLPETRSEMALPLKVSERVIGALDVQSVKETAFDEDDAAVLQILADQLAVAIEKARLFEQTQAALEERLGVVISNTPVILFALDQNGVFTLSEGKGLEGLGLEPEEVVGQSVYDLFGDLPEAIQAIDRALAGEPCAVVLEGQGLVFETWYSPLLNDQDEVTGVIGVATDVTERRQAEEALRESERRMQQQERIAAVGQLAGGIAHDFNNFLTSIILYTQLLLNKPHLPADLAPSIRTILDEARGAAKLVRQILDFSRRSVMETQPIDLVSFVEEAVAILQRTLPETIHLTVEVRGGELIANADPTRIQQVVMNLVVNARDAMPEGGDLRIGLSRLVVKPGQPPPLPEMTPGEWVCLAVTDTGSGIPPEVLPHVFEPFFTTKPRGKGTGLGLAQVYGIVIQHKGYVGIETEVGEGTTFTVYLPAYSANQKSHLQTEVSESLSKGTGELILVVEDNEQARQAVRETLLSLDYRVLTAADGRAALEVYRATRGIDLVLTDMVMPEMGGRELIRQLTALNPDLKAIAFTGYALTEDLESLRREGIRDIVRKPCEASVLARAIRQVLDGTK